MGDEAKVRDRAEEEKEENKNERSESPTSPATDESILEGLSDEIQEMLKVLYISQSLQKHCSCQFSVQMASCIITL